MRDDTGRVWRCRRVDEYEPFDVIEAGDVIRFNGKLRKVRQVKRSPEDAVRYVTFAIQRRSWTNNPYTVYTRPEIRSAFGGIVARGASLCTTEMECAVQRTIEKHNAKHGFKREITAAEMAGAVP